VESGQTSVHELPLHSRVPNYYSAEEGCPARTATFHRANIEKTSKQLKLAFMSDLDSVIARYASTDFDDSTPLLEAGLESLALLRLAVEVATDDDAEIDATRLVDLRTVGDLKGWLRDLEGAVQ